MKMVGPSVLLTSDEVVLSVDENKTLNLGQGYDVLSDRFSNAIVAVQGSSPAPDAKQGGQIVRSMIDVIEDVSEFRNTLRISISAAARMSFGRASAHYSLFRNIQVNSNDVFALLYVTVLNAPETLYDPRLSDAAKEEWSHQKPAERKGAMIRAFGDSYVSSITTGGEFLAVFRLHTTSRREREEVKASAKASFGLFNAKGSYSSITEEFAKHSRITTEFTRIGGEGPMPNRDVESLLAAAQAFPDLVNPAKGGRPRQIYFTALPLETAPDKLTNIDLSARSAMEKLEDIARVQDRIAQRLHDANFVREAPELFVDISPDEAREMVETLESAKTEMGRLADDVIEDRFRDWSSNKVDEVSGLPVPPLASVGAEIPLKITLAAFEHGNLLKDYISTQNTWITFNSLVGVTIECDALAEATYLEYQVVDLNGNASGWTRAGQTASADRLIRRFQARIVGNHAGRYTVRYAAKFEEVAASYYAEDGNPVWEQKRLIRALKVTVLSL